MDVLKTTSPGDMPSAPIDIPSNIVPSCRANIAGFGTKPPGSKKCARKKIERTVVLSIIN
jgi:hypothetical protein